MSNWILPVFIFAVWCLWPVAAAAEQAVENASLPEDKQRGLGLSPLILLLPAMFWLFAAAIDDVASPWGTYIIGSLNALIGIVFVAAIVRACWRLRRARRNTE